MTMLHARRRRSSLSEALVLLRKGARGKGDCEIFAAESLATLWEASSCPEGKFKEQSCKLGSSRQPSRHLVCEKV